MTSLSIIRPDDWHVHLRDGDTLKLTVPHAARYFGRSIVMPNLRPPAANHNQVKAYRDRIKANIPDGSSWQPLMTLYLTDNTDANDLVTGFRAGDIAACKLYPAGATTNSDSGVTDIGRLSTVLDAMQRESIPLLVHGEVTDDEIDIFDREAVFIERHLQPLLNNFPNLKVVFEHITTQDAAQFVSEGPQNLAATITAHHLLYNRNHLLAGGIRPHYYCLPVLKRSRHQRALIEAATGGSEKFFLGTDSAPHARHTKEAACGCAGCYTADAALELYAEVFELEGRLDRLESFASLHGPRFYGLPINQDRISLQRRPWSLPSSYAVDNTELVPLRAESPIQWQVVTASGSNQ